MCFKNVLSNCISLSMYYDLASTCSQPNILKFIETYYFLIIPCSLHFHVFAWPTTCARNVLLYLMTFQSSFKNMLQYHLFCEICTYCPTPIQKNCLHFFLDPRDIVPLCIIYYHTYSITADPKQRTWGLGCLPECSQKSTYCYRCLKK